MGEERCPDDDVVQDAEREKETNGVGEADESVDSPLGRGGAIGSVVIFGENPNRPCDLD
jgi:hypothetical protein